METAIMEKEEASCCNPVDPLARYSGLSLFPSVYGLSFDYSKPNEPETELDYIHKLLKAEALRSPKKLVEQAVSIVDDGSELLNAKIITYLPPENKNEEAGVATMEQPRERRPALRETVYKFNDAGIMALRSPKKLVEQAVAIVDDGSELLNAKIISYLPPENKNEEAGVATMEQPRERRPALNRKRARFSLKPDSGLTAVNLEPTLDITQLKDPEELFLAFERLENAKREIRRQTGSVLTDLNQVTSSPVIRPRRPGILGRSVKYKHLFSSVVSKYEENAVSYQKDVRSDILSVTSLSSKQESNQNISVQEREYLDSPTNMDNKVDKILDELLSVNCEDLEGNETISLLQERLQIKPIELEKLSLPELEGIKNMNVKSPIGNFTKPRNALSDIHNLLKGRTPQKENHRLFSHLASPNPSKSPFASLTSLKKRMLQPNPFNDQFSAHDIDELPARNLSMFEGTNEQYGPFNTGKQSSASHGQLSTSHVKDAVGSNKNDSNEVIEHFNYYSELSGTENSLKDDGITNVDSSKFPIDIEADTSESLQKRAMGEKSHSSKVKAVKGKHKDVAPTELNDTLVDSTEERLSIIQQQLGESSTATVMEDNAMNVLENAVGQNDEQKEIQESGVTLKKEGKRRTVNKDKKHLRRQSLAAAGTAWESGLRRSTRIKVRPLEFWKGERLLYGRIHQSLATVIGLKYVSPAKLGGQPTLKVKSYVPNEYKDLVEHAALH